MTKLLFKTDFEESGLLGPKRNVPSTTIRTMCSHEVMDKRTLCVRCRYWHKMRVVIIAITTMMMALMTTSHPSPDSRGRREQND